MPPSSICGAASGRLLELLVNNLTKESTETYETTISGFILPPGASVQRRKLSRQDHRYFGLGLGAKF